MNETKSMGTFNIRQEVIIFLYLCLVETFQFVFDNNQWSHRKISS